MRLLTILTSAVATAVVASSISTTPLYPTVANKALDCAVRSAAKDFALAIQPDGPAAPSAVFDALELGVYCGLARPHDRGYDSARGASASHATRLPRSGNSAASFYVDAAKGNDSNSGTESAPFQTIGRGVAACRAARGRSSGSPCSVLLRDSAPFYLSATLALGPADSGLSIESFPGEHPVLSGAVPLPASTEWSPWQPGNGTNVWVARATLAATPGSLFVNGLRMVRARWPNANPETDLIPAGYSNATSWLLPHPSGPPVPVPLPEVARPWDHYFPNWTWALNGTGEG